MKFLYLILELVFALAIVGCIILETSITPIIVSGIYLIYFTLKEQGEV